MNKTATKTAQINLDASVTLNGKRYTQKDAAAHCLAVYDAMTLRNEEQLDGYFQIGTLLLQIESFCGGDKKRMGEKITSLGLDVISAPDRSDARFIATNWQAVQKMRKDGSLDGLGVSAIRKRLRKAQDAAKAQGEAESGKGPQTVTAEALAETVAKTIKKHGLDVKAFTIALAAALKA